MQTGTVVADLQISNRQRISDFISDHVEELHRNLCLFVRKSGLSRGGDVAHEASELMSEVVERALKSAARFDPEKRIMAWLLGIAANVILQEKQKRAKNRRREPFLRDLVKDQQDGSIEEFIHQLHAEPHSNVEQNLGSMEHYTHLLDLLPIQERELLHWSIVQQMTAHEIASQLGSTPGAIRVRIFRASKRLRDALEKRGNDELTSL